jgi:hypothetical protein
LSAFDHDYMTSECDEHEVAAATAVVVAGVVVVVAAAAGCGVDAGCDEGPRAMMQLDLFEVEDLPVAEERL